MRQTKGAIGNLLNRYKAVLKKCHLLNTFGSLAVASMLVMGGVGVAQAEGTWTLPDGTKQTWDNSKVVNDNTKLSGTFQDYINDSYDQKAGVVTIDRGTTGVTVLDNTSFIGNSTLVSQGGAGGAIKALDGFTIGNNVTFSGNSAIEDGWGGGAIYIRLTQTDNDEVTIGQGAKFINNTAKNLGGAIALEYGNLNIEEGAVFRGNQITATEGDIGGGAIAVWHDYTTNGEAGHSKLTVTGATFDSNTANISGGAIYNSDGDIDVSYSIFTGNKSTSMGGAIVNNSGPQGAGQKYNGTITIRHSVFEGNEAGNGGAVWQGTDGTTIIEDSQFNKNTAKLTDHELQRGGAIVNADEMTILRTTFAGNEAGKTGGAIANVNPSAGFTSGGLTLADVTFDGNKAGDEGGALYNATANSVTFKGINELANDIHNEGTATVATGTTSLYSGYTQDSGSLTVKDGATLESLGTTMQINGGTATFETGSTFVVNAKSITENAPAVKVASGATLDVKSQANLIINDAVAGVSYNIVDDDNATPTTPEWEVKASSDMFEITMDESGNASGTLKDATEAYTGLSGETGKLVNELYATRGTEGNEWNYANTQSTDMGVRFLSRATDTWFLGNDKKAAVSTIESAARIAFAGAVPQMTKMASDAATNAVVNRMGFANPENGAKAMNVDGKLVDDKALGLALWIAPLWSNQTGFGMEAGNLDYGYNANLGGISLGADYTWANNIRAGLMFNIGGGYAESAGGDLSETTNSMTFWGVGAYGGWEYNNFAVMADVSYTSTWNSVDQDVDHRMGMGDLEADIQASAISAGLRFEYKLETQYLDLIPHVGARYMSINTWGYDVETNGGTVLEGDGFQQNIWTFPVGITFSKELEMNNDWYFKPSVDFTVIPAAGDIKAKEDVRFTGLPYSTEIETQMMDYFTWQGGLGLEFGNDNMSVGVNYTLQAGQNSTGHGVFGMFRYEF